MPEPTHHLRTCHLCEAMCGIEVRVEEGQITRIRANQDDVWSKGHLCPKGATLGRLHHDPDRLRTPLVRDARDRPLRTSIVGFLHFGHSSWTVARCAAVWPPAASTTG